jgi:ABC-type uncharacterized transport system auxiliary subunit
MTKTYCAKLIKGLSMKRLVTSFGLIFLMSACTTPQTSKTTTLEKNTIVIEEEQISQPQAPDTTKKKVQVAKPGLISDKTRDAIADGFVDAIIEGKIKEKDTEKENHNVQ